MSSARIVIIEDNPDNLDLMSYLLKKFGYTVTSAMNGEEGLNVARREAPDLIICDLQLPKIDGYEVARQLKNHPALSRTPLVAVTAYAMVGDHEKVMAAGFDGYLTKPIEPETFVQKIENFIKPELRSTHRPHVHIAIDSRTPAKSFVANVLLLDNAQENLNIVQATLEPSGYRVVSARTISEALALARGSLPDLIISDVQLNGEDGFTFLEALKNDSDLKDIPFVFLTSSTRRETDWAKGIEMGAAKFIFRPIEPRELLAEIRECLAAGKSLCRDDKDVKCRDLKNKGAGGFP